MWGTKYSGRRSRARRSRFEVIALVLGLALITSQAIGVVAAAAGTSRERTGAFSTDTTKASTKQPDQTTTVSRTRSGGDVTTVAAAPVQVDNADADLEGWRPAPANDWTDGNVCGAVPAGSCYRELDNVPHRILFTGLTAGTDYYIDIRHEFTDGAGHTGYDNFNGASAFAGASAVSLVFQSNVTCGGKTCKEWRLSFHADAASAEIRFNAHLAIGAHLWSGSNLSVQFATSNETVTIPVNEIVFDVVAHKFNDLDGDGTQDSGEPDLASWTMSVYKGPSCDGNAFASGQTNADGDVTFRLTGADTDKDGYVSVAETLQAGWTNTTDICQATQGGTVNFGNRQLPPDLTITKDARDNTGASLDGGSVSPGDSFEYVIRVANGGQGPATGVVVTDDLDDTLTVDSAAYEIDGGASSACNVGAGNTIRCPASGSETLGAGQVLTVTVSVTTSSDVCGTLMNRASVAFDQGPSLSSNQVQVDVTGCAPNLTIVKSASSDTVNVGDALTYTIDVANTGNGAATGVVIKDNLSDRFTNVSAGYDVDPDSDPSNDTACAIGAGNTVTCNVGTLAADDGTDGSGTDEVRVTITATAPTDRCDSISNRATVDWDGNGDALVSNAVDVELVGCAPNLTITKSASSDSVDLGGSITYTIDVVNDGNRQASGVVVTDSLPDGVGFVGAEFDIDPGSGKDGDCTETSGVVTCDVGTLARSDGQPGGPDEVEITIDVTAPADGCGTLTNIAHVDWNEDTSQQGLDSSPVDVDVTGCSVDVSVTKQASDTSVVPGDSVTFTIVASNNGSVKAENVQVTDSVPVGLTIVSAGWQNGASSDDCAVAGQDVACDVGDLGPGQSATVTIVVTATAGACPSVENTASVSASNEDRSATGNNESETVTIDVTCAVSVGIEKTNDADNDGSFHGTETAGGAGQDVDFKVVITNTSEVDVTIESLTDVYPGLSEAENVVCDGLGVEGGAGSPVGIVLAPGDSLTCMFTLSNYAPEAGGSKTNTVVVAVSSASGGAGAQSSSTVNTPGTPPPPPAPLGIQIVKGGPALAHVGDTITYTFDVSLTTSTPLTNITVTDPLCSAAPTLGSKSGGDQDSTLEPGETWHYSCTHVVSASDPDPLPNTATARGTDNQGRSTSDTDDHLVDIIHPEIRIVKTANPTSIAPGETVTYSYEVTNVGDVTLFDVSVDDDKLGHICDITQLDVGETHTCTKDFTAGEENLGPIKNVAVAAGEDETGHQVSDEDKASIDVVLGTTVTPPATKTPPGGTAFTGGTVLPLGAAALVLLFVGTGLIYLGRRRENGSEA